MKTFCNVISFFYLFTCTEYIRDLNKGVKYNKSLDTFHQYLLIEHLSCVKHNSKCWKQNNTKQAEISALVDLMFKGRKDNNKLVKIYIIW